MKKFIAFDIDDTLAVSKQPISARMNELLDDLMEKYEVCVISGGIFSVHKQQIIDPMTEAGTVNLGKLHVLSTCGTQYFKQQDDKSWDTIYKQAIPEADRKKIADTLESVARELGYWEENPAGEIIEDRETQVTFSALGQKASPEDKYAWDPDHVKKYALRDKAQELVPEYEFRAGGTTSIDVTQKGVDKAFGMRELMQLNNLDKSDILFIGDNLKPGGNDYPVKEMGIDTIAVERWEDTALVIETILKITN
ncbi:HAD-IIB family hydrolase [Candidatus Saccharibacteria bacterium]|nr:HAD-IIB family hydrolase [Candidatus Saccharibacteria bacterium]